MDEDELSFGQWLQRRRLALHLTQQELGRLAVCSAATIRKLEADERRPSTEVARLLATALRLPEQEHGSFLHFARGESARVPTSQMLSSPDPAPLAIPSRQPEPRDSESAAASTAARELVHEVPSSARQTMSSTDRNRSRMLKKVRDFWIGGVLDQSLHGAALLALGLQEQPEAVVAPWALVAHQPDQPGRVLPPGASITTTFDELSAELLLLGAPGAGKTTLLLALARALLARAEQDVAHPLPVVFNLSSWTARRSLAEWLVDEMNERYDVPRRIGAAWVQADQILPLLDGLDEVRFEQREACVAAINQFRREHGLVGLVVCSRDEDYAGLTTRLKLQSAVLIQPLTLEQIEDYLAGAGEHLAGLRTALAGDVALRELAVSPLVLSVMTLAYQGRSDEALRLSGSVEEQREQVFAAYVERMLQRRAADPQYSGQQMVGWLSSLARGMVQQAQSVFLIERLQPDWLTTRAARRWYIIVDRLVLPVVFGLVAALVVGLGATLAIGVVVGSVVGTVFGLGAACFASLFGTAEATTSAPTRRQVARRMIVGALFGSLTWLAYWSPADPVVVGIGSWAVGVISALANGPGIGLRRIIITETLRWSDAHANRSAVLGMVVGFSPGLALGLIISLTGAEGMLNAIGYGLVLGLMFGTVLAVVGGISGGFVGSEVETSSRPNQGIWRSASTGLGAGILSGLGGTMSIMLVMWLAFGSAINPQQIVGLPSILVAGLVFGIIFGTGSMLLFGGSASMSHLGLRLVLWWSGTMPWNIARFCDASAERILLRKVGGGYIFAHRLLLEYFATRVVPGGPASVQEQPSVLAPTRPPHRNADRRRAS